MIKLPGPGDKFYGDELIHLATYVKTGTYDIAFLKRYFSGIKVKKKGRRCWEWMRSTAGKGYGVIMYGGVKLKVHRLAHELFNGKIPKGKMVCHVCDNPRCCNPSHLYIGDASTNLKDAMDRQGFKNPYQEGVQCYNAKLTDAKVRKIRASSLSYSKLADKYGVSVRTIRNAKKGITWKHVRAFGPGKEDGEDG